MLENTRPVIGSKYQQLLEDTLYQIASDKLPIFRPVGDEDKKNCLSCRRLTDRPLVVQTEEKGSTTTQYIGEGCYNKITRMYSDLFS